MKFAYSFDGERYESLYGSVEEALKDAIVEIEDLRECNVSDIPEKIFVGECQDYKPSLLTCGYDVIEAVQCDAYEEGGEYAEDYLDDATKEQVEELEKGLDDVFQKWIEKYKLYPNFYTVPSYKTYTYDEAVAYIKKQVKRRAKWLNKVES